MRRKALLFFRLFMPRLAILASLLILFFHPPSSAQQYPVQITTVLPAPYSIYLSHYGSPESSLQLIVTLSELDRSEYRVKFRVTIEGMGIVLRTKAQFTPSALVLTGGVPEILTGSDVSQYFHPDNVEFSGISKSTFLKTGTLPEGFYTFKFEVLDYNRGVVVSNPGIASAWIVLNDPPLINMPFNNEKLIATDPQNIVFSWAPRHTGSPNSAFNSEYEITLVELYPANRNPNDAIRSSAPLFKATTSSTSFYYGITEPPLIPGRKYAFTVRAYDVSGRDLFKNNGYSEVFVFQYGDVCIVPSKIEAKALDDRRAKFTWNASYQHTSFTVEYQEDGQTEWTSTKVDSESIIIPELRASTSYQYRVQPQCGTIVGVFSEVGSVKTKEKKEDSFVCGAGATPVELDQTPLPSTLKIDDLIYTADFEVVITEITQNPDNSYKGKGRAFLPWLNLASVAVKFHNIKVNDKYRVFSGNVTTIYTQNSRFVMKLDLAPGDATADAASSAIADEVSQHAIAFQGEIKSVVADVATGILTITDRNGKTSQVSWPKNDKGELKDVLISDASGDTWTINKNGTVTSGPSAAPPDAITDASKADFIVTFGSSSNQVAGFDAPDASMSMLDYKTTTIHGKEIKLPWKALERNRQDYVTAKIQSQDKFPDFVGFKTTVANVPSQLSSDAAGKDVILIGGSSGNEEEVYAYTTFKDTTENTTSEIKLGAVNTVVYDKQSLDLFIVPVNTTKAPDVNELATTLNSIYSQAVVSWDVYMMNPFTVDPEMLKDIDTEESGVGAFPEKMRDLIRAYKADHDIDKNGYYIFLIDGTTSDKVGFMPFKRQFGFVFSDKLAGADALVKTIAHELGHGAFHLRHPFDEIGTTESKTDNLMDYSGKSMLRKYQWDNIHNPQNMISWLMDDGESAMSYDCHRWFTTEDDCEDVGKILEVFNTASLYLKNIALRGPSDSSKELVAENIELKDIEYGKIRITNLLEKGVNVTINPLDYEEYEESFLTQDGTSETQKGFIFRSGPPKPIGAGQYMAAPIILKIILNHDQANFEDRLLSLKRYLFAGKSNEPEEWPADKIIIRVNRVKHNNTRTVGILNMDNGKVTGYTLELPKGTESECQSTCTTEKKADGECRRISKGVYKFDVTTWSSKDWAIAHSLRLENVPGRDGILIHRGVNAKIWSEGCLLAMRFNPVNDTDKTKASERANEVEDSHAFCTELHDYVKEREAEIKEKFKLATVEKLIYIDEEFESED